MSRLEDAREKLRDRYLSRLPTSIDALRAALENADEEELRRVAHRLQGSGGTYGFDEISLAAMHVLQAESDQLFKFVADLIATCVAIVEGDESSS